VKSVTKYKEQLKEMCPDLDWLTFDEVDYSKARPYVDVGKWKEMTALKKKYDRCIATYSAKTQEAEESNETLTLENFKHEECEIDPETELLLKDQVECEIAYYGFEWDHPLTKCEDYRYLTWEQLHMDLVTSPQVLPVEVLIKSAEQTTTKTGKPMLKMRCEDALRQTMLVTVWSEEIERFGAELQPGACVRLRVKCEKAKDRDSYWYNLESFGFGGNWQERLKMPKDRANDFRVYVMKEAK
jgi:DNA polymerase III alpha subunit